MSRSEIAARNRGVSTLVLTATSLGFVLVQFDVTVVNVALDRIGAALGGGVAGLQWVVNAYTVVFASLILSAGALGDRIGAKRVFVAGFALFTAASMACGAAPDLATLIAARAVQGIGAAILVPCSLSLLSHTFHDDKARARAIGIWAAGASLALAAGPVAGGLLVDSVGWRTIFFVNLPIGVAGIWLSLRFADETDAARDRALDLPGQLAAILSLALFAGGAIEAGTLGWGHPAILGGFALAAALGVGFVAIETRSTHPMVPLRFFQVPDVRAALLGGLAINTAFYGQIFVLSLFLQRAAHERPLIAGLTFLPMTAAVGIANIAAGRVTAHGGARWSMILGQVICALGCLSLLTVGGRDDGWLWLRLVAIGGGIGLAVPALTSILLDAIVRRQSGVASGVLNTTRQAGSVVGVALFGSLVGASGNFVSGVHAAAVLSAGFVALGALAAWLWAGQAAATQPQAQRTANGDW